MVVAPPRAPTADQVPPRRQMSSSIFTVPPECSGLEVMTGRWVQGRKPLVRVWSSARWPGVTAAGHREVGSQWTSEEPPRGSGVQGCLHQWSLAEGGLTLPRGHTGAQPAPILRAALMSSVAALSRSRWGRGLAASAEALVLTPRPTA